MMIYLNLAKGMAMLLMVVATTYLPKDMVLSDPSHWMASLGGIALIGSVLVLDFITYRREMPGKAWSIDSAQSKYLPFQVGFYFLVMLFFSFQVIQGADQIAFAWCVFAVFLGNVAISAWLQPHLISVTQEAIVKKDLVTHQKPLQSLKHIRYHKMLDHVIFEFKDGGRLSIRYAHLGSTQLRQVIQFIRSKYKGKFTLSDDLQKMIS